MLHANLFLIPIKSTLFTILVSIVSSSCTTTDEGVEIEDQPSVTQDESYMANYVSATKKAQVYVDFETRVLVSATHLSPAFTSAFSARIQRLFETIPFSLEEASAKTGFFISVYAPENEKHKLDDAGLWNIRYTTDGNSLSPVTVKKIQDKLKWQAFFPAVNDWTTEYLVVFDSVPFTPNNPQMVQQKSFTLTLAGIDSKVSLKW